MYMSKNFDAKWKKNELINNTSFVLKNAVLFLMHNDLSTIYSKDNCTYKPSAFKFCL